MQQQHHRSVRGPRLPVCNFDTVDRGGSVVYVGDSVGLAHRATPVVVDELVLNVARMVPVAGRLDAISTAPSKFLNNISRPTATGLMVFDIPKGQKIRKLDLHDSPFS